MSPSQAAPNQGLASSKAGMKIYKQHAGGVRALSVSYYCIIPFELSNKEQHIVKSFEIQEHMQEYEI